MRTVLAFVVAAAACGGPSPDPTGPRPLGVRGHLEEADRHEHEAEIHEQTAAEVAKREKNAADCASAVLADQTTSGGERLLGRTPCWTAEPTAADRHREIARVLRADARAHRTRARQLAGAERVACAGMPEGELAHSVFAHREDIAGVEALVESDHVRGARIRFRRVGGLSADYLRASIACHQARAAALGFEPTHFGYDPSVLPGTTVSVTELAAGIVVLIRAPDEATALAVYGRAEALLQ